MANFISIFPRDVQPKGISRTALPNQEEIQKYIFDEDYAALQEIKPVSCLFPRKPMVFYPGCGSDVLTPLLILEKAFPDIVEIDCLFVDVNDNFALIKTILDDNGISLSEKDTTLSFYWHSLFVTLSYVQDNVLTMPLPEFEIYFERAFRIMKDADTDYEQRVYQRLCKGGILISDSGFLAFPLQIQQFPSTLSAYGEMICGVK